MRDVFGWAVCQPEGWHDGGRPLLFTVSGTRADAIGKAAAMWGPDMSWKKLYRKGWRARHVQVTPILFGEDRR